MKYLAPAFLQGDCHKVFIIRDLRDTSRLTEPCQIFSRKRSSIASIGAFLDACQANFVLSKDYK